MDLKSQTLTELFALLEDNDLMSMSDGRSYLHVQTEILHRFAELLKV